MPEPFKLEVLGRALDPINSGILQALREVGTTFDGFLHTLSTRYSETAQLLERRRWELLAFPNPEAIRREDLRVFQAKLARGRNRVEDSTPEEEYKILMANLPEDWRLRVVQEEDERGEGICWLRVGEVNGFTKEEVVELMARKVGECPMQVEEKCGS